MHSLVQRVNSAVRRPALRTLVSCAVWLSAVSCGGGGSSDSPTQPVDNSPARVEIAPAAPLNLISGSSASLTATVFTRDGRSLGTAGVTWSSSGNGIATVVGGVVIAKLTGSATITATAGTATASVAVTVAPGEAAALALRTQPVAGTAYAAFTTPAVVEVRDAAGNVTASTAAVTATLASGGGALGGTTTVNALNGVATFTDLTVNGTAGARTLTFSSGSFSAITTTSFNVATAAPAFIGLASATLAIAVVPGSNPASPSDVAVTNSGVIPLTNLRAQSITYNPLVPGNWLAVSFPNGTSAPATIRLTITSAALTEGTYVATIVIAGDGATATQTLTVTLTVAELIANAFGTAANKVSMLTVGGALSPGLVTTAGSTVTTPDATVTYHSRSSSVAAVDATGRVTALTPGQSWIVATSTRTASDSVLVIVTPTTGVVLRTDLTTWSYRVGDVITIKIQADTRGAGIGALTLTFTWPRYVGTGTYQALTFVDVTPAAALAPQSSYDSYTQVLRITGASTAGVTGLVDVATVRLRVARAGVSIAYLTAVEILGPDLANLLGTTTSTSYPIIVP